MFHNKYKKSEANKPSFLEKLIGVGNDDTEFIPPRGVPRTTAIDRGLNLPLAEEEEEMDGELAVDVYETDSDIIVQTMTAGVRPEELSLIITPNQVTISGKRENAREVERRNFMYRELYWGSFSRTIELPKQVEPDLADAVEKHGLLVVRLPKLDKEKTYRVKIKAA